MNKVVFNTNHKDQPQLRPETGQPFDPEAHQSLIEADLAEPVQHLISQYQTAVAEHQLKPEIAAIHVDEIASKVALLYEKFRKIVDWKEIHLVRRAAIERVLKRRLISEISGFRLVAGATAEKMAEPIVLELVRGGHFLNDSIPRSKIKEVERTLSKYIYILRQNPLASPSAGGSIKVKKKINFYNWILEIAACEIEEILEPLLKEKALIQCMTAIMNNRIRVQPEGAISQEEKTKQIYVAVQRSLFNLEKALVSFRLLKYRYSWWLEPDEAALSQVASSIFVIISEIEKDLNHPLKEEFSKICEKYDTVYRLLGDILDKFEQEPEKIPQKLIQTKILEKLTRSTYNKRLTTLRSRLFRMAIYSTLSIFVASGFSLFIIEVPLARLLYGRFNTFAIFIDIMLPTALMFILVALVRPPGKTNLERVVKEMKKMVYPQKEKDVYEIRAGRRINPLFAFIITALYLLTTFGSLVLVFMVFKWARVPITSIYIDTLNVAVIVFAALVVRRRSKELVVQERTTFWEFLLDMLSVPVAKIGQWIANKWKEYNIVSVFMIALVDAPFSAVIEFIESWSQFLKQKKAGLN